MKDEKDNPIDALLEASFKKEPDISLPYGFARVVARNAFAQRSQFKWYMKSLGIGILLSAVMLMVLYVFVPIFGKQIAKLLFDWKYTVIFILAVVSMIQYLDYNMKIVYRKD